MYIHRVYIWIYNIHIIHKINTRMATYRYMCVVRVCACVWSKVYFRRRIFAGNKKKTKLIYLRNVLLSVSSPLSACIALDNTEFIAYQIIIYNEWVNERRTIDNHLYFTHHFQSSFNSVFFSFLLFSSFWCVFLFVVMMMFEMRYMFCQCVSV